MLVFARLLPVLFASAILAAPLSSNEEGIIPGSWIVVMKDTLSSSDFSSYLAGRDGDVVSRTKSVFEIGSFKGYSGKFTQTTIDAINSNPQIAYTERDTKVHISTNITQNNATWGLGRISHKAPESTDYIYDDTAGAGTYAYVLDTGIYVGHNEFDGRAIFGVNLAGDGLNDDGNGHGTHCAGTIGSKAYGVSKKINLIAVKVLDSDGEGSASDVISGIEWATNDMKSKKRVGKALANMSLSGAFSKASNDAVAAAVKQGLFVAVAAGNDGAPADRYSPASEKTACTIGATDRDDSIASYSNYGGLVDIFAPGTDTLSTWKGGPDNTNTISGTSMATPHIVGLAAYLTALEGNRNPTDLCERIRTLATDGALTGRLALVYPGTPNKLAYNGNGA